MYYCEEVINGVLCYKTSPAGKWNEFSAQSLTEQLKKAESMYNTLKECYDDLKSRLPEDCNY